IALNAIDMMDNPALLPKLQHTLLSPGGTAMQSAPYIWHESVAEKLRRATSSSGKISSARAIEELYESAGFRLSEKIEHLPWLFFKHLRQLEIYSVHAFLGKKVRRKQK
ncbi:MAG: hypothetical protein AAB425_13975, partial [Bdellovibrionota bacterium]